MELIQAGLTAFFILGGIVTATHGKVVVYRLQRDGKYFIQGASPSPK